MTKDIEEIATIAIDCGLKIHKDLGTGLLESVYEAVMFRMLERKGLYVEKQKPISFTFDNMVFNEGFRADLLVENKLLIELKSTETISPVHGKQVLTYLRLMDLPLGLLINFGMPTFKEGIKRIVNNYQKNL